MTILKIWSSKDQQNIRNESKGNNIEIPKKPIAKTEISIAADVYKRQVLSLRGGYN